jgi:hypothetical protein
MSPVVMPDPDPASRSFGCTAVRTSWSNESGNMGWIPGQARDDGDVAGMTEMGPGMTEMGAGITVLGPKCSFVLTCNLQPATAS